MGEAKKELTKRIRVVMLQTTEIKEEVLRCLWRMEAVGEAVEEAVREAVEEAVREAVGVAMRKGGWR